MLTYQDGLSALSVSLVAEQTAPLTIVCHFDKAQSAPWLAQAGIGGLLPAGEQVVALLTLNGALQAQRFVSFSEALRCMALTWHRATGQTHLNVSACEASEFAHHACYGIHACQVLASALDEPDYLAHWMMGTPVTNKEPLPPESLCG